MQMAALQQEHFTIKTEHRVQESFEVLDRMRREGKLCDVTLVAGDAEVRAHKPVLASCSPYFYSMFTSLEFGKGERVELDVDPRALLSVIDYMYTSKLTVEKENIKSLLEIAKLLVLTKVQADCLRFLERTLSPRNCFHIRAEAIKYEDVDLLKSTSSYIDTHFARVVASDNFLSITNDQISELISRDTLRVPSEEKVYECVVRWINHDPKGRRKYLRALMGQVRLQLIPKRYIKERIVNDPFLKGDTYCKDLIINGLLERDTATEKTKARRYWDDNKILITIGGLKSEAESSLEYYDFETGRWSDLSEILPYGVTTAGLVVVDQKVYVVGGERNGFSDSSVRQYDTITNTWHSKLSMRIGRSRLGVVTLNNSIYVIGGRAKDWSVLNKVERYSFASQKWFPVQSMFTEREDLGVCVLNNVLYAMGGRDGKTILKSVECYDPNTDTWKKLRSMNECRSGVGACTLDGRLYVVGGWNGEQYLATAEMYDPDAGVWTEVPPMSVPRAWAGVAAADNLIYAAGGQSGETVLSSTEIYDKVADSWSFLPESMNVARCCHVVGVVEKPS